LDEYGGAKAKTKPDQPKGDDSKQEQPNAPEKIKRDKDALRHNKSLQSSRFMRIQRGRLQPNPICNSRKIWAPGFLSLAQGRP
jgi:hypothetical protein